MRYLYMLPAAFLAPVIHEWVKAIVSTVQGDPTPRNTGHLTLNPFKYFEPIGFVFVLLFGVGWGKPTPTAALHYKNRQRGVVITYTVPALVNLLLGIGAVMCVNLMLGRVNGDAHYSFLFVLINFSRWMPDAYYIALIVLSHFAYINILLALFNLIPVYPLAANKLLLLFCRPENIARINHYEKPMQIILILALAFGFVFRVLQPIANTIARFAWGLVG